MDVVPAEVGLAARAWDEQHLDLAAASRQLAGAGTGGFTPAVSGAAARFCAAWSRHTAAAGAECEARADGLRATVRDYLRTDDEVAVDFALLLLYLGERR